MKAPIERSSNAKTPQCSNKTGMLQQWNNIQLVSSVIGTDFFSTLALTALDKTCLKPSGRRIPAVTPPCRPLPPSLPDEERRGEKFACGAVRRTLISFSNRNPPEKLIFQGMARNIWVRTTSSRLFLSLLKKKNPNISTFHWCSQKWWEAPVSRTAADYLSVGGLVKKRVLEEKKKRAEQKRKTIRGEEEEEEEECPSERGKRPRMNNNKIEKENEQSEFSNHEEEVRLRTWFHDPWRHLNTANDAKILLLIACFSLN